MNTTVRLAFAQLLLSLAVAAGYLARHTTSLAPEWLSGMLVVGGVIAFTNGIHQIVIAGVQDAKPASARAVSE